jgi:hypothetical protein
MGFNTDYLSNYGIPSANFAITKYNWTVMPDSISAVNWNSEGALATDTLIYQCGVAVNMIFDTVSSNSNLITGNNSALTAYTKYFG